jgi:DNA gyrase subunit A
VNKAKLCERIADLVKEKLIEGISEIRDESDKSGMRVVIELRRAENSAVILNQLYKMTQMQESFGINMVALIKGQPRLLNLKEILVEFLKHRREVITRRTVFDLRKARERGHILEGLAVALSNVDEKISLIKAAASPALAKTQIMERVWDSPLVRALIARTAADSQTIQQSVPSTSAAESSITLDRSSADGYYLSAIQAQAILELRLQRLTALEQDKIIQEYTQIVNIIADLQDILNTPARVDDIISTELTDIKCQFGDARRSRIEQHGAEIDDESLIMPRDLVVTLSHTGYIKTQSADEYRTQKRGGRGKSATANKEDDFVQTLFIAHTHDYILCFSTLGRMYWLKVYNLPEGSRGARGKPIVNLLNLQDGETITAILPVKNFTDNLFVFMATALGTVKKVALSAFSHPSARGIIAINLDEGDKLAGVALTDGSQEIMLFSDGGKAVRFNESHVRDTGRSSRGVRGMKLGTNCKIVALLATADMEASVLTATENGYGKRTGISAYRLAARSTQGVKAIGESLRNGKLVAAKLVNDNDELILITDGGTLIRTRVSDIREIGRSSMGVKLINLNVGEKLVDIERVLETIDNIDDTDNIYTPPLTLGKYNNNDQ